MILQPGRPHRVTGSGDTASGQDTHRAASHEQAGGAAYSAITIVVGNDQGGTPT